MEARDNRPPRSSRTRPGTSSALALGLILALGATLLHPCLVAADDDEPAPPDLHAEALKKWIDEQEAKDAQKKKEKEERLEHWRAEQLKNIGHKSTKAAQSTQALSKLLGDGPLSASELFSVLGEEPERFIEATKYAFSEKTEEKRNLLEDLKPDLGTRLSKILKKRRTKLTTDFFTNELGDSLKAVHIERSFATNVRLRANGAAKHPYIRHISISFKNGQEVSIFASDRIFYPKEYSNLFSRFEGQWRPHAEGFGESLTVMGDDMKPLLDYFKEDNLSAVTMIDGNRLTHGLKLDTPIEETERLIKFCAGEIPEPEKPSPWAKPKSNEAPADQSSENKEHPSGSAR